MGLYIKGMRMPENGCDHCYFRNGVYCSITNTRVVHYSIKEQRSHDCPLVEVPPHGRLIDADALECMELETCDTDDWYPIRERIRGENFIRRIVKNAPTVIPAEEEDTNG